VHGSRLPYTFTKELRLTGSALVIGYQIQNLSKDAFRYPGRRTSCCKLNLELVCSCRMMCKS
jgi:hypothetical protein